MAFFSSVLDLLFPTACVGCGEIQRGGAVLCMTCFSAIPRHRTLCCSVCLARVPDGAHQCHSDLFSRFGAATDYEDGVLRDLVQLLKFKSVRRAADPLAELLAAYVTNAPFPRNAVVLPVPLSSARERERGFNQSELIARRVAAATGRTCAPYALRRIRNTKPQSGIAGRDERSRNISGAFSVHEPAVIIQRDILLIDDVRTSGATLHEAARTLKDAGARSVSAAVVCRVM